MEKLTPEQIHNWRRIMSTMGMNMLSSILPDEEIEKLVNGIQHRIAIEEENEKRSIEESNKVMREAVHVSGFKNTIRVVKGK